MTRVTPRLTIPDLVVLSLLFERPRHGYDLVRELERREVEDWAGISRPQVYYSLAKLARMHLLRRGASSAGEKGGGARTGPDRIVYDPTPEARKAVATALAEEHWCMQRPPPPFLTWFCLSTHAPWATARRQLERRRRFLKAQLEKEAKTLAEFGPEGDGPLARIAREVVGLAIRQFQLELDWLQGLEERLVAGGRRRQL